MISVKYPHKATQVINSRPHKKKPVVWRRRQDEAGFTFTTYERPSLAENQQIKLDKGGFDRFNLGRLILSISASFSHDKHAAQYDSLWLAQTVEETLSMESKALTRSDIANITYETLKRFDALAAVQYGAKHQIISNVRRRGRPSIE